MSQSTVMFHIDDFVDWLAVMMKHGATESEIQHFLNGALEDYRDEIRARAKAQLLAEGAQ